MQHIGVKFYVCNVIASKMYNIETTFGEWTHFQEDEWCYGSNAFQYKRHIYGHNGNERETV